MRLFCYLPRAYKNGNDLEARRETAIAALEAGIAINNSSVTSGHGMSRPIGALYHVPHGLSNAMLLYKCMSFAKDGALSRFAELARAIGVAEAETADGSAADLFYCVFIVNFTLFYQIIMLLSIQNTKIFLKKQK